MKTRVLLLALMVAASGAIWVQAEDEALPTLRVSAEGLLVQADFNTDFMKETDPERAAELEDTIEGSVSFMVDVPFKTIVAHMTDPGTLGSISPNIAEYEATKVADDDRRMHYKVREELAPFKFPLANRLGRSTVHLDMFINKAEIRNGRLVVDYALDPEQENDWKRFSGAIYAVDLHNGNTMVMVATSTKSNYNILPGLRLKLAKHFLAKTKENIVGWLQSVSR